MSSRRTPISGYLRRPPRATKHELRRKRQKRDCFAQLKIASAKERAASLEKEAAQARAEQERLKQIVSWRVLSKEAGEKLVFLLAKNKALITLAYVGADPEVLGLAIQFSKIFEAAHWQVLSSAMTFSSQLVFEIRLPVQRTKRCNYCVPPLTKPEYLL